LFVRCAPLVILLAACRFGFDERTGGDGGGDGSDGAGPDVTFGDCWSAWRTGPLSLSPPILLSQVSSSTLHDGDPWLSTNGLALYIAQAGELFVATRPDRYSPFGPVVAIAELNSPGDETKLSMTADELVVVWSTNRQGSQGYDLWEATRTSTALPFGPPTQMTLGQVNDSLEQFDPHISGDGLRLYYAPLNGPNQFVDFAVRASRTSNFGAPTNVTDLGTNRNGDPSLSPDELVIAYSARLQVGDPLTIWYATRSDTSQLFANARRIPGINDGTLHDQDPALSFDGCELFFSSSRTGNAELYVSVVQ
jgi:Tol biopolymer transport system component